MKLQQAPVKIGNIGAGNVPPAYLQVLDRLVPRGEAAEGPVCARRLEQWDRLRARRPGICLVAEARQVLEADVDAIVIITPPASPAELMGLALEHGKHVLVEKPAAATREEGARLIGLAAERGLLLMAAPFVQLAPTFRALWGHVQRGEIGRVHSARGLYGNAGSTWARWYHEWKVGPLAEVGIYNLKSITALLGPVCEVRAAETTAMPRRRIEGTEITAPDPDVTHLILRHAGGALSSIVASHAIQRYRRPELELYGTEGTANLSGDDWDPRGFEIWNNRAGCWKEYEAVEPTWNWADGLRELVLALRQRRAPPADSDHDLHLLEVIEAAGRAAREGRAVTVQSRFGPLDLKPEEIEVSAGGGHLHDHTRPAHEQ